MSMFSNAPIATDKPKSKAAKKDVTVPTKDVHLYAALKAVLTNVEAQIAIVEAGIKSTLMARGVEEGMRLGAKPESYKGEEHGSTASLQYRCRVSTSALSDEEQDICKEYGIPLGENVRREETFIINPAYADLTDAKNAEMLDKVSTALEALGLPADFIQKQERDAKVIATEDSIKAVCSLKDKATVAALLPLVITPAIRSKLAPNANPFEIVEAALGTPVDVKADTKAKKVAAAA